MTLLKLKNLKIKKGGTMYIAKSHHKETKDTIYFHEWGELDEDGFDYDYYHEWSTQQATLYKQPDWAKAAAVRYTGLPIQSFGMSGRLR